MVLCTCTLDTNFPCCLNSNNNHNAAGIDFLATHLNISRGGERGSLSLSQELSKNEAIIKLGSSIDVYVNPPFVLQKSSAAAGDLVYAGVVTLKGLDFIKIGRGWGSPPSPSWAGWHFEIEYSSFLMCHQTLHAHTHSHSLSHGAQTHARYKSLTRF